MCGLHVFFKKRSRKSRVKDRSWAGFFTVCGPHQHVAAREWLNFFFLKDKKIKKIKKLRTPYRVSSDNDALMWLKPTHFFFYILLMWFLLSSMVYDTSTRRRKTGVWIRGIQTQSQSRPSDLKIIEKNRRIQMEDLYLELNSLLPQTSRVSSSSSSLIFPLICIYNLWFHV